jgi:hypothetical protein
MAAKKPVSVSENLSLEVPSAARLLALMLD